MMTWDGSNFPIPIGNSRTDRHWPLFRTLSKYRVPSISSRKSLLLNSYKYLLASMISMDIPSTRELELEVLLREKDAQLAEMTVCALFDHFFQRLWTVLFAK
jgi:hypothetical protein